MESSIPSTRRPVWQIATIFILIIVAVVGIGLLMNSVMQGGVDYYYTFYPTSRLWLSGQSQLYDSAAVRGFYEPPWLIWILAPFALLPFSTAQTAFRVFVLMMVLFGAWYFSAPGRNRPWVLAFSIFNMHTFDLLYRGQVYGLEVLGITIGWIAFRKQSPVLLAAAFIALMCAPPNTIPIAFFFLWLVWRQWPVKKVAISLTPPALILLASFVVFSNWPIRWLDNYSKLTPADGAGWWLTTLWRAASQLGLPQVVPWGLALIAIMIAIWAWHRTIGQPLRDSSTHQLMLIITTTMVVTPFSLSYRLIALVAVVLPLIAGWNMWVAGGLYALTFLPVTRIWIGTENSWIDIVFVIAVFAAVVVRIMISKVRRSAMESSESRIGA